MNTRIHLYALIISVSVSLSARSQTPPLYDSIYCFGFSWTDTRGIGCGWTAPEYYGNRACNGPMWPEFVSTNLGLAYVATNNFAHCGATSSDVLTQVSSQFRPSSKAALSLYFLWAGDSEFLRGLPPDGHGLGYLAATNEVGWNRLVETAILNNSNAVNRLYLKGARQIVIQSQLDLSKFPESVRVFGTNSLSLTTYGEWIARCNAAFIDVMDTYSQTHPDLRILSVDIFSKLNDVLSNPRQYGFTKTNIDAWGDTSLKDKAFNGPGADYVFWDELHGTSKLQELIAAWNLEVLANSILEKLEATVTSGSPDIQMNHLQIGRDYTLQRSPDLKTWIDVQSFTASAGTNHWSGALGGDSTTYFRLRWEH